MAASGVSSLYITVMLGRLSEFWALAQPKRTTPILSLSLVMILVFMKLRAARRTESILLVDAPASSGVAACPLKAFYAYMLL